MSNSAWRTRSAVGAWRCPAAPRAPAAPGAGDDPHAAWRFGRRQLLAQHLCRHLLDRAARQLCRAGTGRRRCGSAASRCSPRCAITRRTSRLRPSRRRRVSQAVVALAAVQPGLDRPVAHAVDRRRPRASAASARVGRRRARARGSGAASRSRGNSSRRASAPSLVSSSSPSLVRSSRPTLTTRGSSGGSFSNTVGRPWGRDASSSGRPACGSATAACGSGASTGRRRTHEVALRRRRSRDGSTGALFSVTRPSAISRSASRRLATPARASHLAMRSPRVGAASLMPAGRDQGGEDAAVARVDQEFRMPLHAEAEASRAVLDALDDAVGAIAFTTATGPGSRTAW